jgi:hypothetical protein
MMKQVGSSFVEARLRQSKITVYKKADRTGEVAGITKENLTTIYVDYATPGLKGDGTYWSVFHFEKGSPYFLIGYVPEEDIIWG